MERHVLLQVYRKNEMFCYIKQFDFPTASPRSNSSTSLEHSLPVGSFMNRPELILEFEAKSPLDTRDVWPTGLQIHKNGDFYVLDKDNKCVKVRLKDWEDY